MPKKKETRKSDSYELDQIDEAYRNLSGKKKKNSKKKKSGGKSRMVTVIIILVAVLVVCLGVVAALHLFGDVLAPETTPENLTVAGVNIGGLGTPIASLASLITIKFYMRWENAKITRFLGYFTAANVIALCILLLFMYIV